MLIIDSALMHMGVLFPVFSWQKQILNLPSLLDVHQMLCSSKCIPTLSSRHYCCPEKELQHTDICLPELHPHRNKSLYMIVPWWSRNWGVNFIMFPVPRGYCCFKSYAWALVSNRIIIMTVCWKTLVPYRTKALTLLWICSMQCQIGETKKCS
jgi:hypothetical protein